MTNTSDTMRSIGILRESTAWPDRRSVTILELENGEVIMYADDPLTGIQEDIALREYIDANEVYYDFDEGWMACGSEIPYKN